MFIKGATLKQKVLGYVMFVLLAISSVHIFTDVLIYDEYTKMFFYGSIIFSVVYLVIAIIFALDKSSGIQSNSTRNGVNIWVLALGMLFLIPLVSYAAIAKGIPTLLHFTSNKPSQMVVTAVDKPAGYSSRTCSGRVYINEFSYFLSRNICGVARQDWSANKNGSKVVLIGTQSKYGFEYKEYKRLTSLGTRTR